MFFQFAISASLRSRKRLYIIDVEAMKLLINTYVAHGRNSGSEYAKSFSNKPGKSQKQLWDFMLRAKRIMEVMVLP